MAKRAKNSIRIQNWIIIGTAVVVLVMLILLFYGSSREFSVGEAKKFISLSLPKKLTSITPPPKGWGGTTSPIEAAPSSSGCPSAGDGQAGALGGSGGAIPPDDSGTDQEPPSGTTGTTPGTTGTSGTGTGLPPVGPSDDQQPANGGDASAEENACPSEEVITPASSIVGAGQPLKEKLIKLRKRLFP